MARLAEEPYAMPKYSDFESTSAYIEAQRNALEKVADPIITFPRADGRAYYRVVDFEYTEPCDCCGRGGSPLLQHIPYGDGYRAAGETIKGLTTEDAKKRSVECPK